MPRRDVAVTVQGADASNGAGVTVDLGPGQRMRFGSCACRECGPDIVVPATSPAGFAGVVTAYSDHWRMDNLSPAATLVCRDLEDNGQYLHVRPGRLAAPVPFELARVSFRGQPGAWAMTVFGPEPSQSAQSPVCPATARAMPDLDRRATYFAVLRALAQPRLAGDAGGRLPTSSEIADALRWSGRRVTRRAVDHHIDYLSERFGVTALDPGGRRTWKREALVQAAIAGGFLPEGNRPRGTPEP
jgi:hypothetical protein